MITKLTDNKFIMIKGRVMQLIEYKKIPKENFFKEIGMSSSNFRGDAKKTPLNSTAIVNILMIIPDVNAEWLLTGRGEMLRKMELNEASVENSSDFITIPREAWEIIRDQAASLKAKDQQMTNVIATLNTKDQQTADVIAMLKDQVKKGDDVGDYTHVATRAVGK